MAQAGFTPISIYYSTTAAAAPTAGNLVPGELAINITDGKLYYEDNLGAVQVIATKAGANGDVVGPASSTANAIARFSGTTGKIIQNSGITIDASNNVTGMGTLGVGAITTTGVFTATAGTVSAPAITTTGDTNTGIFFPAADTIAFTEGGAEAMRIDSSGNVLIGTTTSNGFKFKVSDGGAAEFAFFPNDTGVNSLVSYNRSTAAYFPFQINSLDTRFLTGGGSERMRIDSSGNVGIGTSSPVSKMDFGSSAGLSGTAGVPSFSLYSSASTIRYGLNVSSSSLDISALDTVGRITFYTGANTSSATERARIDSSGNVGIGTTSPSYKLDVDRASVGIVARFKGGTRSAHIYSDNDAVYFTSDTGVATAFGCNEASDFLTFYTGNSERMRIDSSGNVGLGVTPSAWGSGAGALQTVNNAFFTGFGNSAYVGQNAYRDGAGTWRYMTSAEAARIGTGNGGGFITFETAASGTAGNSVTWNERMRINSSGAVGIGTNNPLAQLHVVGAVSNIMQILDAGSSRNMYFGNDGNGFYGEWNADTGARSQIRFQTRNSGAGTYSSIQIDGGNQLLKFNTNDTERARITNDGYFKASNDGTYNSSTGAYHEFRRTTAGVSVVTTNTNANPYGVDITFTAATPNNTTNYFVYCNDNTNAKCIIYSSGTIQNRTGTYTTISDLKLKQDVVDANSQWDDIKALRIVKYRLKDEVAADPNYPAYIGVIAQEVEQVSPGLIDNCPDFENVTKTREVEKTREVTPAVLDDEGNEVTPAVTETYTETEEYTERVATGTVTKSVKSSIIYMKAVKALQEAMTRIEALEAEVAAMKGQ